MEYQYFTTVGEYPRIPFPEKSSYYIIPFQLVGKLIAIQATIDNQTGWVLIDSGSPGVLINTRFFKDKRRNRESYYTNDLAGSTSQMESTVVRLQVNDLVLKSQDAFLMDFSRLEKQKGISILGVLGYDFLRRFEMVIDYQKREMTLFALNNKGNRKNNIQLHLSPSHIIPLKKSRHLLWLEAGVGNEKLRLGLDFGSESTVISRAVEKIAPYFTPVKTVSLITLNGKKTAVNVGRLKEVLIGDLILDFYNVLLNDLKGLNHHLIKDLDGLLGYDFFSRQKIGVNFKKRTLLIWKEEDIIAKEGY